METGTVRSQQQLKAIVLILMGLAAAAGLTVGWVGGMLYTHRDLDESYDEVYERKAELAEIHRRMTEADLLWSALADPDREKRSVFVTRDRMTIRRAGESGPVTIPAGSEFFIPVKAVRFTAEGETLREQTFATFRGGFVSPDGQPIWFNPLDELIFPAYAADGELVDPQPRLPPARPVRPDDPPAFPPPPTHGPDGEPLELSEPKTVRVWETVDFCRWAQRQLVEGKAELPAYAEIRQDKLFHREHGGELGLHWAAEQLGAEGQLGSEEDGYRQSYLVPQDVYDRFLADHPRLAKPRPPKPPPLHTATDFPRSSLDPRGPQFMRDMNEP